MRRRERTLIIILNGANDYQFRFLIVICGSIGIHDLTIVGPASSPCDFARCLDLEEKRTYDQ